VPLIRRKQTIDVTQENKNIDENDVEDDVNPVENEINQDIARINYNSNEDDIVMDLISNEKEDRERVILETGGTSLRDFSKKVRSVTEKSPYIKIIIDEKSYIIKKSSYCWLLDQSNGRVGTDRLKRFIGSTRKTPPTKNFQATFNLDHENR
jgi:hypothetical protein